MNASLTVTIKQKAFSLGADLVGVGNVERWDNCPEIMGPTGLLPSAKSVVVLALHHGDATIEIGGEKHPQIIGPYAIQYFMNDYLDMMSYEIGRCLEDAGFKTIPITASNIWRYNTYKELDAVFAPDISHIYAAVATGLAELGYSGLAMTPEFGPRNRFVSIITDAPLVADPLLSGDSLCDRCMLCAKHCPAAALTKEVDGEVVLEIEGHKYVRADKNLWRCSWGEHFDLDLDLPIPDKVTEEVVLDTLAKHGMRSGEMGQCLKHCLPPQIREWDRNHTSSPRRRRYRADTNQPLSRGVGQELVSNMLADGLDMVIIADADKARAKGVDVTSLLPNASRLVMMALREPEMPSNASELKIDDMLWAGKYSLQKNCFFAARQLESMGYDAASYQWVDDKATRQWIIESSDFDVAGMALVATNAPLTTGQWNQSTEPLPAPADLTWTVKQMATEIGADVVGISTSARIDKLAEQLAPIFGGESLLEGRKSSPAFFRPCELDVRQSQCRVHKCTDYIDHAKSVIVLGSRIPKATVNQVGVPPAEAIGPYAFAAYQSLRTLQIAGRQLIRKLRGMGYTGLLCTDLTGTGSTNCSPRLEHADIFANRFAAVCAGLGTLGEGGFVLNPQFGPNLRFIAIVTDAPLDADDLADLADLRSRCDDGCDACVKRCAVTAHRQPVQIELEGQSISFRPLVQLRCDWAKRYALVGDEGLKFLGSQVDIMPPDNITPEDLAGAFSQHDPIIAHRLCVAEMCAVACPLATE